MRTLALGAAAQLALSVAYIYFLSARFELGGRVIVLHAVIVAALGATLLLTLGLAVRVRRMRESPAARWSLTFMPLIAAGALGLLYVGDYASNLTWGRNLNFRVLAQNLLEVTTHGQGVAGIRQWLVPTVVVGLGALVALHQRLSKRLWEGLEALFAPGSAHDVFGSARRSVLTAGAVAVAWAGIIGYVYSCSQSPSDFRLPRFEPIASFVVPALSALEAPANDAARRDFERTQATERAAYRQPLTTFQRRNVIVILVDALRADHMSLYGYGRRTTPFLDRLAQERHLLKVETALSTCSQSSCGVQSTMSSAPYSLLGDSNFKLWDLLRDQGYRSYLLLSGIHDWYGLKEYYGTAHDLIFSGRESRRYNAQDDRVLLEGLEKVPGFAGAPAFFYFHLMSAHEYGFRRDSYNVFLPARWNLLHAWLGPNVEEMTNWYDNGVLQADATIEQLMTVLQQKGYTENSLIILLSDHGQGLGEHGTARRHFGHLQFLYQEQIRIPMLILDDSPAIYRNLELATQLDVAPTLVDRLGLPVPASWHGRSLLQAGTDRMTVHQTALQHPLYLVFWQSGARRYKYMRAAVGPEELYEIVSDPRERQNLISTADPALVQRLRHRLSEYLDIRP